LPATVRHVRVRADAGFDDYKVVRAVEAHRGQFFIIAKLTPLQRLILGLAYTEVRQGLAVAECQSQPQR